MFTLFSKTPTNPSQVLHPTNAPTPSAKPEHEQSLEADTEIAQATFSLCETRDGLNGELEDMYQVLLNRLEELEEEEAAAATEIEALKATEAALQAQLVSLDDDVQELDRQLKSTLG